MSSTKLKKIWIKYIKLRQMPQLFLYLLYKNSKISLR
nr:MAG TPA: hypothetical protein [Ackermannviridae sp.]